MDDPGRAETRAARAASGADAGAGRGHEDVACAPGLDGVTPAAARPLAPADTIAAICTAPGAAGLAVLRVSGPAAFALGQRVFRGGAPLADAASHTLHHGWVVDGAGRRVDEVVAAVFRGPRSYTGEDVVELSCHGGRWSAERVLVALRAAGARLAAPGEFTQRAFLHGRIDLAQAEAVADVIHAGSAAAHELALGQLAGGLSRRLAAVEDRVTDALAEVEARVDFAEDVGGVEVPPHVIAAVAEEARGLRALLAGAAFGRALREGVRLPLVGRPNVGKSSLFNALLGEERAIVTPLPGTTRDRVSESLEIAGVRVALSDTAGLRAAADPVEAIGIGRARAALDESRCALWVIDGAAPLGEDDRGVATTLAGKRVVVALNQRDRGAAIGADAALALLADAAWAQAVEVSAVTGVGIAELLGAVAELVGATPAPSSADAEPPAVSNARHADALERALAALDRAAAAAHAGEPGECVALELREALGAIGEVTGRNVDDEVLDRIFGRFCIGK